MQENVIVCPLSDFIIVDKNRITLNISIPEGLPESLSVLSWKEPNTKSFYRCVDSNDVTYLEETQETYDTWVAPFVSQYLQAEAAARPEVELTKAKEERAEAVSKLTVTVDGMVFDADETSQNRMSRVVAGAQALGVDLNTTTQIWVLADNTVATPTVAQLAQALKLAGEAQTALWTVPYRTETTEPTAN